MPLGGGANGISPMSLIPAIPGRICPPGGTWPLVDIGALPADCADSDDIVVANISSMKSCSVRKTWARMTAFEN